MFSGTGRHRRPRRAPALLVTAGVTGAGIALPLLGAGSASAVSDSTWDQAAECESGGDWHLNTGNGYYGGFQLTLKLWEQYGGLEFAIRPDLASRDQQIAVVEQLLADQGHEGLPGCSVLSGLWGEFRHEQEQEQQQREEEEEAAEEEARQEEEQGAGGETEGSADEGPADAGQEEGSSEGSGDASGDAAEPDEGDEGTEGDEGRITDEAGSAAESPAEDPADPGEGTGRHRGDPDPDEAGADPAGENSSPGQVRRVERGTYEVRSGDMLSAIAVDLDVPGGWPALYQENKAVIGDDPDYILPGQRLDVPVTGR